MSKAGLYTDIEVRCPDDSSANSGKISFRLHRAIVCSKSDYFQSMMSFNGISGRDRREYNEQGEVIVDLDDIPASAFVVIRDFLYTGKGCTKMEQVSGVLIGADFLGIEHLFQSTLKDLIYNPFREEAIEICNSFSNIIPADVKNYVMNFQTWSEQMREDPAARATLDAIAAKKPFGTFIRNYSTNRYYGQNNYRKISAASYDGDRNMG